MRSVSDYLPAFDGNANLPPGDYWPEETAFVARFVQVDASTTRSPIYEGWRRLRGELVSNGVSEGAPCLLNGSYTTSALDPSDLDCAIEVTHQAYFDTGAQRLREVLLGGPKAKPEFNCDAYPVIVLPESDPDFKRVTEAGRAYWKKWFGRDRKGNVKGRVWTHLGVAE